MPYDNNNIIDQLNLQFELEYEPQYEPQANYELRDYQKDAVTDILKAFEKFDKVCFQLPTGGGKTVIFANVARHFLRQGEGVLVLAHRQELIYQAKEKLESVTSLPVGLIKSGTALERHLDIQVASIQTLVRREWLPDVGLVIVDEAHHAVAKTYKTIFERLGQDVKILGVTATPNRSDGQGLKKVFQHLLTSQPVSWFIEKGYLAEFKMFAAKRTATINTQGIKISSNGDFDKDELSERAMGYIGETVETWKEKAQNKQTLIFGVDLAHCEAMTNAFLEEGINAAFLNGKSSKTKRKNILNAFKEKRIKVLINCALFVEGFDCPGIECLQIVRPTQSLILWLQMLGRVLRPSPGKEYALILDQTENVKYLGLPDDDRSWSLKPISLSASKFAQTCPECQHIFKPLAHELKPIRSGFSKLEDNKMVNFCEATCPCCDTKFEFETGTGGGAADKGAKKLDDGELEMLALDVNPLLKAEIDDLKEEQEASGYKPAWLFFRIEESENYLNYQLGDWRYVAKLLGYQPGWAWHQSEKVKNKKANLEIIKNLKVAKAAKESASMPKSWFDDDDIEDIPFD